MPQGYWTASREAKKFSQRTGATTFDTNSITTAKGQAITFIDDAATGIQRLHLTPLVRFSPERVLNTALTFRRLDDQHGYYAAPFSATTPQRIMHYGPNRLAPARQLERF